MIFFLRLKPEASGFPDWVEISDDKVQYIDNYFKHVGVHLREDRIIVILLCYDSILYDRFSVHYLSPPGSSLRII